METCERKSRSKLYQEVALSEFFWYKNQSYAVIEYFSDRFHEGSSDNLTVRFLSRFRNKEHTWNSSHFCTWTIWAHLLRSLPLWLSFHTPSPKPFISFSLSFFLFFFYSNTITAGVPQNDEEIAPPLDDTSPFLHFFSPSMNLPFIAFPPSYSTPHWFTFIHSSAVDLSKSISMLSLLHGTLHFPHDGVVISDLILEDHCSFLWGLVTTVKFIPKSLRNIYFWKVVDELLKPSSKEKKKTVASGEQARSNQPQ